MTGGDEGEGSAGLSGRHPVEKAAGRGVAPRAGALDPMHRHTQRGPPQHRQVERRGAVAHPAAVLAGTDVQAQVQARLNAPVVPVGLQQRRRRNGR